MVMDLERIEKIDSGWLTYSCREHTGRLHGIFLDPLCRWREGRGEHMRHRLQRNLREGIIFLRKLTNQIFGEKEEKKEGRTDPVHTCTRRLSHSVHRHTLHSDDKKRRPPDCIGLTEEERFTIF